MSMTMDHLDRLGAAAFQGYLVRKDLVRKYSRQYPVPTYVVEFLLGRYDSHRLQECLGNRRSGVGSLWRKITERVSPEFRQQCV